MSGFDSGIYLMGSNDGDYYKSRDNLLDFSNSRAMNVGGEWFAYTPAASDWYGMVVLGNEENAATSGSMWVGRQETLTSDLRVTRTEEVQFDIVTPTDSYWNVIATRPSGTDLSGIALYDEAGYGTLVTSDFSTGVCFVLATGITIPGDHISAPSPQHWSRSRRHRIRR